MQNKPLSVLGGLTAEQFLQEYWQKKPLLVRNAIPEIADLLEPDDVLGLALEEGVTARLLTQHGKQHEQWQVKRSPLTNKDFKKLPELWTLLVQAIDHFSVDIANLWQHFDFIPQWRRDDIMVSYAPKGGSVGRHYDQYDVFLVQGYGHRRWQLGQYCQPDCALIPDQPLKLLPEMDVFFDEVLAPGDLLYVPPTLSHYGVAQDDCLTFSFGFRMPNAAQLFDETAHQIAAIAAAQTPVADHVNRAIQDAGEVSVTDLKALKQHLLNLLEQPEAFERSALSLLSESKFPDSLPENELLDIDELQAMLAEGATLQREPATRLLYRQYADQLEFWANGEQLCVAQEKQSILKQLADGHILTVDDLMLDNEMLEWINQLQADALILINE